MKVSFRDQQVANEYLASHMACRSCKSPTDVETLGNLGGMCHACYLHYCDAAPSSNLTRKQAMEVLAKAQLPAPNGRACADALRARRERQGYLERPQAAQLRALEAVGK